MSFIISINYTYVCINILIHDTFIYRFFKLYVQYFLVKLVSVFVAIVSGDTVFITFYT